MTELVIFDLYGTLLTITSKQSPYKKLLNMAEKLGRVPTSEDARLLMTTYHDLAGAADLLGVKIPVASLTDLVDLVQVELDSVIVYSDTLKPSTS